MGVSGLLSFVKKACRKGSIQEYSGRTLAVDVSYLLHRGVFGCAGQIATGKPTDFYVGYVRKYVEILLRAGCHVVLVFDGQPLPAKKEINDARRALREKNNRLGHELTRQGLHTEAYRAFQQAVTITAEIVATTIRAFRNVPLVDVIVAPYEADAQIAYLVQNELAYAAVTEDSDLIVFGCERIVFKLEASGACVVYDRQRLADCVCPAIGRRFEFAVFRRICILAGCDYLQGGLQGVGLKKAELFFAKTLQTDLNVLLPKVPLYLNLSNVKVNSRFIAEFIKAENTFLHQVVFDPINQRHVPLNPLPTSPRADGDDGCDSEEPVPKKTKRNPFDYAGEFLTPAQAVRRALGNADLQRSSALDEFALPAGGPPAWSLWSCERFLRECAERTAHRQSVAYEKLGAFAPKCSPRKVRHKDSPLKSSAAMNRSFPLGKAVRVRLDGEEPAVNSDRLNATIPVTVLASDDGDVSEKEDNNDLSSRKRKCQPRRSEPLAVLGTDKSPATDRSSQRRSIVMPRSQQRNGSMMSWNSAEWMRMYGVDAFARTSAADGDSKRQSPAFCAMAAATQSNATNSNPFAKTAIGVESLPLMDGEATSPPMNRPADRRFDNLLADSPRSANVQTTAVDQHRRPPSDGRRSIASVSGQSVRRTLIEFFTKDDSSQSSSSGDSQPLCQAVDSQSSSSSSAVSTASSQTTITTAAISILESATLSQDVFYRRRSSSSQQLTPRPSPIGEATDANAAGEGADKENLLAGINTSTTEEKKAAHAVEKPRVSPYFLQDSGRRLAYAAAYRPSGLGARAAAFPRVL